MTGCVTAGCMLALTVALCAIATDRQSGPPLGSQDRHAEALQFAVRAQQELAAGQIAEARHVLVQGTKAFPREAALWNLLGAADAEQNQPAQAKQNFQRAISLDPRYTAAYLNLGHLEEIESAHDDQALSAALDTYHRLLDIHPGNAEANFQYALIALEKGAFADSLAHLRRMSATELQRPRAQAILCADLAATGHLDTARFDAASLLPMPELSEADLLPAIDALAAHDQVPFAIVLLQGLRRRGLASPSSTEELGELEESQGKLKESRKLLEEAARDEPENVTLLMRLAEVANSQRDYRGALGYLAHARNLEPRNASVHFFFGMVCVQLDLHEEAYESLKKAVSLDPDNPYYNYALGAVCTGRTDSHEAVVCFQKYCRLKPHDSRGRLALGAAYYYAHNLTAAQAMLNPLVNDPIADTAANYYLGRVAADEDRYGPAAAYLKQAIRNKPDYADAYAALGMVLLDEKDYSASFQALQRSLALQPDNYLANLNLSILYLRTKDGRAAAQQKRLAELRKEDEERAKLFLRTIRVVP
jgi:tetratricopeptide (TPR) repeat protein